LKTIKDDQIISDDHFKKVYVPFLPKESETSRNVGPTGVLGDERTD
jgi:hypothetical protein